MTGNCHGIHEPDKVRPLDIPRCRGLRDGYTETVRPLPMCRACARWQQADTAGIHAQWVMPHAAVRFAPHPALFCEHRIAGDLEG